ncbi:MAG: methyltransferase domain-containing protein [Pseudomonadota bacterium]
MASTKSRKLGDSIVRTDGWNNFNIWDHSQTVLDLYTRRARDEEVEMTCAAQAAELLSGVLSPGESVIDAGCGSGYFFHSLRKRGMNVSYRGFDASERLIAIGKAELPEFGLDPERLTVLRIEDFQGAADHMLCMNVLSNIDNYHRPLERLLLAARKTLVLRESISENASYAYVRDDHLDPGIDLKVHVNTYARGDILTFISGYGFTVEEVVDRRTGGAPEMVIGHPHCWTFLVATRT